MSSDQKSTESTQEARKGEGVDSRFNSKLREAFGSSPFILTKFDKFMNWVRGSSMFMLQFGIACCSMNMDEPRTQFMNLSNLVRMNGVEPNASRSVELKRLSTPSPSRASCVDWMSVPSADGLLSLLMIGLPVGSWSRDCGST